MLAPNTILANRYVIKRAIGKGGMGAVYEAFDQRLDNIVALKETFFTDERLRRQFEREARLLARLSHPALPRVIDHFSEGEGQFLVMGFIPGDDLSEMIQRRDKPFSPQEVVGRWGDQLLDALDYLHTQEPPILHRDIKPANLKLTARGQVILLDFGLAKDTGAAMSVVGASGSIFGYTPNYAPLEQIQGTGTGPRSDLYSLAATMYHLMTGVTPPDVLTRAALVLGGKPDPLRPANEVNPEVPPQVGAILVQAMAQTPDQRPTTADEMRAMLRDATDYSHTSGPSRNSPPRNMQPTQILNGSDATPTLRQPSESPLLPTISGPSSDADPTRRIPGSSAPSSHPSAPQSPQPPPPPRQPSYPQPPTQQPSYSPPPQSLRPPQQPPYQQPPQSHQSYQPPPQQQRPTYPQQPPQPTHQSYSGGAPPVPTQMSGGFAGQLAPSFATSSAPAKRSNPLMWIGLVVVALVIFSGLAFVAYRALSAKPDEAASTSETSTDTKNNASKDNKNSAPAVPLSGKLLSSIVTPGKVFKVALSPDGNTVASTGEDNVLRLWKVSDGSRLRELNGHTQRVSSVAVSPDGQTVASGSEDNTVRLWRMSDGTPLKTLNGHTKYVFNVAFSPDGQTLMSAGGDKLIQLWKVSDGSKLSSFTAIADDLIVNVSEDLKTVAVYNKGDKSVRLYSISDDRLIRALQNQRYSVSGGAFSPDGSVLALGSEDGPVRLWNVADGTLIRELKGPGRIVGSVAFDAVGKNVVAGYNDGTIWLWNASDGTPAKTFEGHASTKFIYSVAFSDKARVLASGSEDKSIRVWQISGGT